MTFIAYYKKKRKANGGNPFAVNNESEEGLKAKVGETKDIEVASLEARLIATEEALRLTVVDLAEAKAYMYYAEKKLQDAGLTNGSLQDNLGSLKKEDDSEMESELAETKKKLREAEDQIMALQGDKDKSSEDELKKVKIRFSSDADWNAKYKQLREYCISHKGDCRVPQKDNPSLFLWVHNQRFKYANLKKGRDGPKISKEQIRLLEGLEFSWGKAFKAPWTWNDGFGELQKFQKGSGHCNVEVVATNPSPLAKWVSAQRVEYILFIQEIASLLKVDQIEKLKSIGFNFDGPRLE